MRVLDFSDGFTSSTQPTIGTVPASGISVTPTGNVTSTDVQSALVEVQGHVDTINAQKAAINGLASLDSSGHVPVAQLPAAALGALSYKGALDASVGTYPASPAKGDYYVVNVAGTIATVPYKIGDWATYDGTTWDKVDNGQAITSVAGRVGVITLTSADVGLANVSNTSDATKNTAVATLTNKTLTTPIIDVMSVTDQGSVPSTPAAGTHKLYSKAAGMFILDSTGAEKPVGSGSGGGSKNYIANPDFELNVTTGWTLGKLNGMSGSIPNAVPTFGSGASANLSIATTATGKLAGSYSLSLVSSAATTAGDMLASDFFTIDKEDQAKVLTFKFYYSPTVGSTTANWSGTNINSFGVAIYDVTNAAWIIPAGAFGMTQGSGVGLCTGTFQTPSNGSQFRLVVYNANFTSGAITLLIDDVSVGPQVIPIGYAGTDIQTYSPVITGFGTPTAVYATWQRRGDTCRIYGEFTAGTSTAVIGQFSLPPGLVAKDSTMLPAIQAVGTSIFSTSNTTIGGVSVLIQPSVNYVGFGRADSNGISLHNGNTLINVGESMSLYADIPIQGWSSNVQMSSDTDTRVVDFSGTQSSQAVTASVTDIAFTTGKDSHGAWNGTQFTVPVSGDYLAAGTITNSSASAPAIYVNGTIFQYWTNAAAVNASSGATLLTGLKAGDKVSTRVNVSGTISGSSFGIFRISGPSVIAASESVSATYGLTTAQSVTAANPIKYDTKIKDTHGAYNAATGLYTAPVSGQYAFSGAFTSSTILGVYFVVNGVTQSYLINGITAGTVCNVSASWPLNAGDTIALYIDTSGTFTANAGASGYRNIFNITRTGN